MKFHLFGIGALIAPLETCNNKMMKRKRRSRCSFFMAASPKQHSEKKAKQDTSHQLRIDLPSLVQFLLAVPHILQLLEPGVPPLAAQLGLILVLVLARLALKTLGPFGISLALAGTTREHALHEHLVLLGVGFCGRLATGLGNKICERA